jgi:hypothetical protein
VVYSHGPGTSAQFTAWLPPTRWAPV